MTAPTTGATLKIALDQRASSRHDGFAADSGASRGDLLTRAICPSETFPTPLAYDRPRPFVALQDWAYYRAESERKRSSVRLGVLV